MYKSGNVEYKIQSCPSNDQPQLENLLNEMSKAGWELYSMSEIELNEEFHFNCIFMRESQSVEEEDDDLSQIMGFKSQMERIMSVKNEPFEQCKEIQRKIKDKRNRITKIKNLIDGTSEPQRSKLNEEISKTLLDLSELRSKLRELISPDIMIPRIGEEKLSISLSEEIIDLVNPDLEANLVSQTVKARQELTEALGYVIPRVKFQDDEKIQANEYCINIRAIPAFRGRVYLGHLMYFKDELNVTKLPAKSISDVDFYTGRQVVWIPDEKTKDYWLKGKMAAEVISENLKQTCIKYIENLFDYTDVNCYIEIVGMQNLYLIENIIPDFLSVAEVKFILSSLIKENISIKDIMFIFEKINDFADEETKEDLLDKIRISLNRQISKSLANQQGVIQGFILSKQNLEYLASLTPEEGEENRQIFAVNGSKILKIFKSLKAATKKHSVDYKNLILVVPYQIRYMLYMILSEMIPNVKVIAKEEISPEYSLEIIEQI